nr:ketopantoate reductase C-terminal domain-containing protein [Burkholderia ambifaria]
MPRFARWAAGCSRSICSRVRRCPTISPHAARRTPHAARRTPHAARRATEVEWINGEIVRLAARFGVPAPINARLCALVHDAETAASLPAWCGDALWAELATEATRAGGMRAA